MLEKLCHARNSFERCTWQEVRYYYYYGLYEQKELASSTLIIEPHFILRIRQAPS